MATTAVTVPESPAAVRALFSRLPKRDDFDALKAFTREVWASVDAILGTRAAKEPLAFTAFNPLQRALLEALAGLPAVAQLNADTSSAKLEKVGAIGLDLDGGEKLLTRYVGRCKRSVLEDEVDGRPLWLWLRLRLMGKVTEKAWQGATSALAGKKRIELARLAFDGAYNLARRWPLPRAITPKTEAEDAAALVSALKPLLNDLTSAELGLAVKNAPPELLVLAALLLAERGEPVPARLDGALKEAMNLSTCTTMARELVARLPASRREKLVGSVELVAYDPTPWRLLGQLDVPARSVLVLEALQAFKMECRPAVVEELKAVLPALDDAARKALAKLKGPNARVVAKVLRGSR